jgi:hypothetical protein
MRRASLDLYDDYANLYSISVGRRSTAAHLRHRLPQIGNKTGAMSDVRYGRSRCTGQRTRENRRLRRDYSSRLDRRRARRRDLGSRSVGGISTPERFLAFARRFGEVVEYLFLKGFDRVPEIIPVVKLEHERVNFGRLRHSDIAYLEPPPMGTTLIARGVAYGGNTLFANA